MDVEKEINQLKYQIKLLKFMVNAEEFPFFMFALDHNFTENQVNSLIKVLSVLNSRLNGHVPKEDETVQSFFKNYKIEVEHIYKTEFPTILEFLKYVNLIFADKDFEPKYLLESLRKQSIHETLCAYLLSELEKK